MKIKNRLLRIVPAGAHRFIPVAITTAMLSGCALPAHHGFISLPADGGRIAFKADAFAGTGAQRVRYTDIFQREEYARFLGRDGNARAEVIVSSVSESDRVSLNYGLTLEAMTGTWTHNTDKAAGPVQWGRTGMVRTGDDDDAPAFRTVNRNGLHYRAYQLSGRGSACFAFFREWDPVTEDDNNRYRNVILGYYCEKGTTSLSKSRINSLASLVSVAPEPETPAGPATDRPDSEIGNPHFPFEFAEFYYRSDTPIDP